MKCLFNKAEVRKGKRLNMHLAMFRKVKGSFYISIIKFIC